jgi:NADH dehydrogenase FAD-containing subunit
VGSINNTFGIKGVQEHTMFFKNIDDANRLRRRMSDCFERASLPQASEEVRVRCHVRGVAAHTGIGDWTAYCVPASSAAGPRDRSN